MKLMTSFAALCAVSCIGFSASAQESWYGAFGGGIGQQSVEFEDEGEDINTWNLEGVAVVPLGERFSVQVDASYTGVSEDDFSGNVTSGSAHLIMRDDSYALGGYIGFGSAEDVSTLIAGGEAAWFLGPSTIALGAGYGQADVDDDSIDVYGVNGEYRFFFTEDFRLDARLGYQGASESGEDETFTSFGVGGEWRPTRYPVSIFANYDRLEGDNFDGSLSSYQFGLRILFGPGDTLMSREREATSEK